MTVLRQSQKETQLESTKLHTLGLRKPQPLRLAEKSFPRLYTESGALLRVWFLVEMPCKHRRLAAAMLDHSTARFNKISERPEISSLTFGPTSCFAV